VDLFDVARSCFRRWYVVLPLMLITTWFAYNAYTSVKPVYYSNAVIGLAPPSSRLDQSELGVPVPRNGLLDVGGAPLIAQMGAIGLSDPSVVQRVVAAGGQPNYISKLFPVPATSPPLPLIMIEATENQSADAIKTVEAVIAQADSTMRNLQAQAGVPDGQMVQTFMVSPPSQPAAGTPSRTRSTISIFLAGAGLSVLIGTVIDVVLMRRKPRAQKHRYGDGNTAAGANPTPPQQDIQDQRNTDDEQDGLAPSTKSTIGSR
jgi:hypothetical protein